jgi:hypothetical protein
MSIRCLCLQILVFPLERRRSRHPHLQPSQSRLRPPEVFSANSKGCRVVCLLLPKISCKRTAQTLDFSALRSISSASYYQLVSSVSRRHRLRVNDHWQLTTFNLRPLPNVVGERVVVRPSRETVERRVSPTRSRLRHRLPVVARGGVVLFRHPIAFQSAPEACWPQAQFMRLLHSCRTNVGVSKPHGFGTPMFLKS